MQPLRPELSRLRLLGLRTPDEKVKELEGAGGEEGDRGDGVGVLGEEEEEDEEVAGGVGEEEDWLPDGGREEARCCSRWWRRSRRWRRRVEESSKASALRPEAVRLARRALAWLGEAVREGADPSLGCFLRPGANAAAGGAARPEKMPALTPERHDGSMLPPVPSIPKAFKGGARRQEGAGRQRRRDEAFQGVERGEITANEKS